jgi:hypothetical protein
MPGTILSITHQGIKRHRIKISTGQLNELRKNYPDMTAEYIATEKPDHTFNLINRDQRTPIFEPEF